MSKEAAFARYAIISNMAERGPFTWKELQSRLEEESELHSLDLSRTLRTIQRDLKEIRNLYGLDIQYVKRSGRYTINEEDSARIHSIMFEHYNIIQAYRLSKGMEHALLFEPRESAGTEHLFGLLHAIKQGNEVTFTYTKYWENNPRKRRTKPLALKEFKHRWYLLANDEQDRFKTFPLDRISDLSLSKKTFHPKKIPDFDNYYRHTFGITNDPDKPVEEVILTFTRFKGSYIQSLPLHPSQRILQEDAHTFTISLKVKINYELISEILSHGDEVRVDAPEELKKVIKQKAANIQHGRWKEGFNG
ncbi:helix-turn-helix transcriptional regulator [Pleomorphovibrio marinus]|uniref:helix-turn-helix transcriptional regulator n=1 Tax=Pleomorphovibrio marinus TaxID=2164132 RepID=UPI000E0B1349|nr:WYL domain-containing protein [Pleomorphovibrio marinus]